MKRKKSKGDHGEAKAAEYLSQKGYTILESQWRCRFGELDLIARDKDGTICFVEVKLRDIHSIALPREFVTWKKQERLRLAASAYLSECENADVPTRFDVAEVYAVPDGQLKIVYIENAFM